MCRLCFSGENEGSERAKKMHPCSNCGKKYHRSCLKTWSQHRGLLLWVLGLVKILHSPSEICFYLQIYFTGVHGHAPHAVHVR